jgi:hypothetical protein
MIMLWCDAYHLNNIQVVRFLHASPNCIDRAHTAEYRGNKRVPMNKPKMLQTKKLCDSANNLLLVVSWFLILCNYGHWVSNGIAAGNPDRASDVEALTCWIM